MAMSWWARVGLGAGVGLLGTLLLAYLVDGWWIPAAAGGLLGAVGFLGSFFVWSADAPPTPENPEGYEQILFDGRNSVASALLIAAMVGLAFFARFDVAPAADEDHTEYLATQDGLARDLEAMRDLVVAARDQRAAGETSDEAFRAALSDHRDAIRAIGLDVDALEPPAAHEPSVERLKQAVAALTDSIALMDSCAQGNEGDCGVEEEFLGEADAALSAYASAGAASAAS